jgi:hypothetical protein
MVRTQVQLTEDQALELRGLAARRGQSMADLIREGVSLVLRLRSGATLDERRQRAINASGTCRFGAADVAENHQAYFAEAVRRKDADR